MPNENRGPRAEFNYERFIADCRRKVKPEWDKGTWKETTLNDIALHTGYSYPVIWRIANNKGKLQMDVFLDLCNFMHLNPADYFTFVP